MTFAKPEESAVRAAHGRARAWAGMFRLPLRNRVWRGMSGDFAGKGAGSSLDFQDHRAYMPGDDPRHINWQAYARTGNYTMKLFREEVRPLVDVALDVSPSMFFDAEKAARAAELFAFALEGAQRAGAIPRTWLCGGGEAVLIPVEAALSGAWPSMIPDSGGDWSADGRKPEKGAPPPPARPALERVAWRAQALRVVVSDLLFPGAPEETAGLLSARDGRGLVLCPYSPKEAAPDWDGNVDFHDVETGGRYPRRVDPPLLTRYRAAYARHFELWKAAARRHGVALARVPSNGDFAKALQLEALPTGAVEPWA